MKITENKLRRVIRQIIKEYYETPSEESGIDPDELRHSADRGYQDQRSLERKRNVSSDEPPKYIEGETEFGLDGMPIRGNQVLNPEWVEWSKKQHH